MAEATLFCPTIASQEHFFRLRAGGELRSRGVFPSQGTTQIRARECTSVPGSNCSSTTSSSDSIRSVLCKWAGKGRKRVEAGFSQSRVSQLIPSKENVTENDRVDTIPTGVEDMNLGQDQGPCNGRGAVPGAEGDGDGKLQQGSRTGFVDLLAMDVEVIREGVGGAEQMLLLDSEAETGKLMNDRCGTDEEGGPMVKGRTNGGEAVQESAGTSQFGETLARDGEVIQQSVSSAVKKLQVIFPFIKEETKARFSKSILPGADKNLNTELQSPKTNALGKVRAGLPYFEGVKEGLVQAGEAVLKWAEVVGQWTGVDKTVQRDVEFIWEGINSAQEEVKELLRVRHWEDTSIAGETRPSWPEPAYFGLSGKDLLAADIEGLKSYGNYFKGFLNTWRIPLQLSYDPEAVASYFNRRPHLLLFRLLEVSAAFSGVALQLLLDKARVRLNPPSWIGESEDGGQSTLKHAEALKQTFLRLGPTFIKAAQSLSSRPDLIGIETAKVLSELQDRLPPFPTGEAMAVIEMELGVPAAEIFSFLSTEPVAAASFGQVYRGRTREGEEVAVKVQRPDLLFDVALDIYVLRLGLRILRKLARMNSDISLLADELGSGLFGELDYTLEAANANEFGASVRHLSYVKVPRTFPHLTRKRVLTMEWMTGYRPVDLQLIAEGNDLYNERLDRQGAKLYLDDLVRKGVECSLVQLLETGVIHADPHAGNLLYTKEGILVYLDFGLLAHVTKKHRSAMLAVIAHLVNAEWQCLANDFGDLDILKPSTDRFALRLALERAFGEGPDAVVKNGIPDIQFGQVTTKLWKIALKFRFRLPPYYTLVLRALASLEGIAVSVDPDYKVFASAYPYVVRRLLSDNSRPSRRVLQSLVLTQKREFRFERIADIMATSREGRSHNTGRQRTPTSPAADVPGLQLRKLPDGKALASVLLSFTLSKEGTSVRRVLLEADTKSLAKAFISPSAMSLRRKVSLALAKSFYLSMVGFRDPKGSKWASMSTSAGYYGPGRTLDTVTRTTEVTELDPWHPEIQSAVNAENWDSLQFSSEPRMNNHRFWFLLKVLASRLRGSPILMVRVSWAFLTMVAFAAALALHKYLISLSNRLLSSKQNKILDVNSRPADLHTNPQLRGDSGHDTV